MGGGPDHLTVIVVSEETAPVRRFRVRRDQLRRGAWIAGIVAVFLVGILIDYTRLRIQAVDVSQLRAADAAHRKELHDLTSQVTSLQQHYQQVRELEHKIRIIANLPSNVTEARLPDLSTGQGGGDEEAAKKAAPADPPTFRDAPPEPAAEPARKPPSPVSENGILKLDDAALARISRKAERLGQEMPAEQASLDDLLSGLQGKTDRLASTPSIWPTDGWVTSGFGYRTSPFTGKREFHPGLDIAANFGTAIVAPARGRVVWAGPRGALGNAVVIDHGHGIESFFGHTEKIVVHRGETVERGQEIALVGSTGRSTGPHVHYTIEKNGRPVNPMDYILQ